MAEAFFYVGLIERWGTGTTRMADALREAGLAEPEFDVGTPGRFRVILRKDPFTEERLRELGLNERQMRAVAYVREKGRITNTEYQRLESISERTATRDLTALARLGVLVSLGTTGRGVAYTLKSLKPPQSRHKAATKPPQRGNNPLDHAKAKTRIAGRNFVHVDKISRNSLCDNT